MLKQMNVVLDFRNEFNAKAIQKVLKFILSKYSVLYHW